MGKLSAKTAVRVGFEQARVYFQPIKIGDHEGILLNIEIRWEIFIRFTKFIFAACTLSLFFI
jgi:hypothetical protein